jgi:hypothetical protein
MSHSVKITTPIPSAEDVASGLGVTGNRLSGLLALVDRDAKDRYGDGFNAKRTPHAKVAAKKAASSRRATEKRGRKAR